MYAPEGYEPLASLWTWFEAKFGAWCHTKAILFYSNPDLYTPAEIFGSPRDLCEDLFLRSLEDFQITLAAADRPPVKVKPVLSNSPARLFVKATPFESFMIAVFPDEDVFENEWLIRMGTRQFTPTGHTDTEVNEWLQAHYRGDASDVQSPGKTRSAFHTLPYLFERESFVFPSDLPPWSSDLLEDAYFRNLKDQAGGRAFCLSVEQAATWRRSLTEHKVRNLFVLIVPAIAPLMLNAEKSQGGRPKKSHWVTSAIEDLKLTDSPLSLKEKVRRVIEYSGESVSESTVKRVLRDLKNSEDRE